MIRNFLTAERQQQESSHGGSGPVDLYEIWGKEDFASKVDFIDRVVVPPDSTIGFHRHGDNEEMYILLEGNGLMKVGDDEVRVKKGDMILNPRGGSHGLVNDSGGNIDILVIQVDLSD